MVRWWQFSPVGLKAVNGSNLESIDLDNNTYSHSRLLFRWEYIYRIYRIYGIYGIYESNMPTDFCPWLVGELCPTLCALSENKVFFEHEWTFIEMADMNWSIILTREDEYRWLYKGVAAIWLCHRWSVGNYCMLARRLTGGWPEDHLAVCKCLFAVDSSVNSANCQICVYIIHYRRHCWIYICL
jgi:hypothetical protein